MLLAVTAAFVLTCRIRLLDVPLERDEGEYAYVAQQWLQGVPPFVSIYHVKLPGVHAAYALLELALGPTLRGIHAGLLVLNLATLGVVFALARRLLDPLAAGVAAACFGVLSLSRELFGFSANAEHFVLLPALLGLLVLLHAPGARRERARLFGAGLLLGLAYTMKQQGVFFVAAGAAWWLHAGLAERPRRAGQLARDGAALALGALLPLALLSALFAGLGLFEKFWWWTWDYPRSYVTQIPLANAWGNFLSSFHRHGERGVLEPFWPLLLLAALGLAWLIGTRRRAAFDTVALLLLSAVGVAVGFHFFPHYYLLAAPALALLAGAGALACAARLGRPAACALAAAVIGFAVYTERDYLFRLDPIDVSRTAFGGNPFPESLEIARHLAAHTAPDERIAVLGSEPQIYFYAGRRAATGWVYTYEMMREHPWAHEFQEEMAREIEAARPRYVVMVHIAASWQPARLVDPEVFIFDWARRFLGEHYTRVGVVEIRWPYAKYGAFCWEERSACQPPPERAGQAPLWIAIHERRPDAAEGPPAGPLTPPASAP